MQIGLGVLQVMGKYPEGGDSLKVYMSDEQTIANDERERYKLIEYKPPAPMHHTGIYDVLTNNCIRFAMRLLLHMGCLDTDAHPDALAWMLEQLVRERLAELKENAGAIVKNATSNLKNAAADPRAAAAAVVAAAKP